MSHAADLLGMSRDRLDEVFRTSPAGQIPEGRSRGTAIVFPGSWIDRIVRGIVRVFWWKGKVFRRDNASGEERNSLKNLISPFAIRLFEANVYRENSWFADGEAIILDYSKSSFLVRKIRDEIRQVTEGLYLGQVFWGKKRIILFMLEFPT